MAHSIKRTVYVIWIASLKDIRVIDAGKLNKNMISVSVLASFISATFREILPIFSGR